MALTFFWRCEGTTLDGTHDYSAGDTTASIVGAPTLSETAAKIGTNGILTDASTEAYFFDSASIVTIDQGSMACWVQYKTSVPTAGLTIPMRAKNLAAADYISFEASASQEIGIVIRAAAGSNLKISTTVANLAVDNWYFITCSWHLSADKRRIRVYNSAGKLIEEVEDTSTDLSGAIPAAIDDLRIGNASSRTDAMWVDNAFVGSSYDDADAFLTNRNITSYTEYAVFNPAWARNSNQIIGAGA